MGIYEQPVQHFNVSTLGWLMYIPNDIDIKLWTEFFRKELKKKGHSDNLVGLSQQKPLDGTKFSERTNKTEKDFKRVHVEGIGFKSDKLTRDIKAILLSNEINKLCVSEIRLIPQYNYTESVAFNEKVKTCIMMQKQYLAQIEVMEIELDSVDTKVKSNNNKTIREHILDMNKGEKKPMTLFIEKWNNQGYKIFYPKTNAKVSTEFIKHLPFYLVRRYGDALKGYFDPEIQREIETTIWDETEKRALSETDRDLREASKVPASMTWFSFEPGLKLDKLNLDEEESSQEKMHIQVDTRSEVSTFASKATGKGNKQNKNHNSEDGEEDDVSELTTKSQDTKLTKMQESITYMESKLATTTKQNLLLKLQLKETLAELAKKKLSPESLTSQGIASNTSTISSNSSLRSSKRNRDSKSLPKAKRALLSE